MNKFFTSVCVVLVALASFTFPAAASGINGYFHEVSQIAPIQTATGSANWRVVRPDNGEVMYFGECQRTNKGYVCRGERLVLDWPGSDGGHHGNNGGNHNWNGAFPNAHQNGSVWTVRRPDNGATMNFSHCERRNDGYYCHTEI
jgi:hypothetical protein